MFASQAKRLRNLLISSARSIERRLLVRRGFVPVLTSSLLVTALVGTGRAMGGLQRLELIVYDHFTQWELSDGIKQDGVEQLTDPRLVVLGITQADVQAQNEWPLSDATLAQVLANLQAHGPAVIGIDLYRDVPQAPGGAALKAQLQKPNVIAIQELNDFDTALIPAPADAPPEQVGFNDLVVDRDGIIRRQLLLMSDGEQFYLPFSLLLAQQYIHQLPPAPGSPPGQPPRNVEIDADERGFSLGDHYLPSLHRQDGGYQNMDDAGWQILLDYEGSDRIAPQISLTEVLEQRFDPTLIQGKIILIGNTNASSKDLLSTPYSSGIEGKSFLMPGVFVHAQMVSQLLRHSLDGEPIFRFWSEPGEWLWALGWAMAGGCFAWVLKHPLSLGITGLCSITGLSGITWIFFTHTIWIPLVFPVLVFVTTGVSLLAYKEFFSAFYDPLTGLPNRDRFIQLLEQSIQRQQRSTLPLSDNESTAVMFLDLDRFKDINESLGHHSGDQLLLSVTQRLKQNLPKSSKIARLGGDEFGILLSSVQGMEETRLLVDDLQRSLAEPIQLQGQEVFTSASVGIALASLHQHHEAETLLRDAHTATYRAKAQGKARHEVFVNGMRNQVLERFQLESDLHQALEKQQLFMVYQPFVELETGRVVGFEALVRWNHPQRGLISPGEFIPVAESTGLILPMGLWILRQSCEQMKIWQGQCPTQSLIISVNLSSQQFTDPKLAKQIRQILQETQIDPRKVKLELTESMMMGDVEAAIQTLLNLKQLDLKLGLDDFGTGYSSLSYLHRFPIDTLKIDLSFVKHMTESKENAAIAKTIVDLGHSLSMDIIAEGVETPEQAAALRSLTCEIGQGYFFSKPLTAEAAEQLLAQPPQWLY